MNSTVSEVAERVRQSRAWMLLRRWAGVAADLAQPVVDAVRVGAGYVSTLGWTTLVLGVAGLAAGAWWGWLELRIFGLTLLLLLAGAVLFTLGRTQLEVGFELDPVRLPAGESAAGQLSVTNVAATPLLPVGLEIPVGLASVRYTLPALRPSGTFSELVIVPTSRRGVIDVGPVRTQRGDPFGLMRREVTWTEKLELFVHPRTVALETLGTGLLRDLEGQTTNDVSMSDLAFHTLREYVPGDDRRYIHWRSSAKVSAASGQGTFLVKQFLDTRRSHIAVVVDADPEAYADAAEFELAISVGASVAVRALADELDLTIVCGEQAAQKPHPALALDTFARADWTPEALAPATGRLSRLAPDASVAILVSGTNAAFGTFAHARAHLPPEVQTFAITVQRGRPMALRQTAGISVLTLGALSDLPRLLAGVVVQ